MLANLAVQAQEVVPQIAMSGTPSDIRPPRAAEIQSKRDRVTVGQALRAPAFR